MHFPTFHAEGGRGPEGITLTPEMAKHNSRVNGKETKIIAAITVTGDAVCRATDTTYRMDTKSARSFLAHYVELP